jgi:hypothetical protein
LNPTEPQNQSTCACDVINSHCVMLSPRPHTLLRARTFKHLRDRTVNDVNCYLSMDKSPSDTSEAARMLALSRLGLRSVLSKLSMALRGACIPLPALMEIQRRTRPRFRLIVTGDSAPRPLIPAAARSRSRSIGIRGHVPPEFPVTFDRNPWSRWSGIRIYTCRPSNWVTLP